MVGILSSTKVVTSVVTSVVPLSWCSISIDVHRDRSVIHPSWGDRRVILGRDLSLRVRVVPLRSLLLRGEGSEVSVSFKDISEEYF